MTTPIVPLPPVITSPIVTPAQAPNPTNWGDFAKRMAVDTVCWAAAPAVVVAAPQVLNALFGHGVPVWAAKADSATLGLAVTNGIIQGLASIFHTGIILNSGAGNPHTIQKALLVSALLTEALAAVTGFTYGHESLNMALAASAMATGGMIMQRAALNLMLSRKDSWA